ncbi:HAMP domain-containing histidine kinase [Vitiosangium sp. GDMCC 1.1324]|uniref:HAMP domain-containing histidine kinase n=1 Tax=Vitiosangium sp. (strain GDMCC 1.1324) TaxID=2138576 RepID=UPI000D3B4433|nr:HAMP domain-containing histidine kinase [Vitiosangium sp. GDMCC 1.1324]PTL78480.1 sensor histidine kinase [Vitiosangium sp. GDMCC 1.1324]
MSAVATACKPKQAQVTSEGRHLTAVGSLDGTDVQYLDLGALARHAVALLQATGHVEATEVQLELPDEPVFARVSRRRMEQVMLHLLADAVSACRSEGATARAVRLRVEPQDDFGDYGPTFQLRYASASESLLSEGLTAARELVETLGGSFTVKDHGLKGTTVTVSVELPDQGTASW